MKTSKRFEAERKRLLGGRPSCSLEELDAIAARHAATVAARNMEKHTPGPLIAWRGFPPYFTQDSIERGIFKPETDAHATVEQVAALKSDALYYTDKMGPDMCPAGLKQSARAVLRHIERVMK